MTSPTWSVYDYGPSDEPDFRLADERGSSPSTAATAEKLVQRVPVELTLKGCGLKKVRMLNQGAQGVVYLAIGRLRAVGEAPPYSVNDVKPTDEEPDENDIIIPSRDGEKQRVLNGADGDASNLYAVKRLVYQRMTEYSVCADGVMNPVMLRETTLLTFLNNKLKGGFTTVVRMSEGKEAHADPNSLVRHRRTRSFACFASGIIALHGIVEAPFFEPCLILEYCPLTMQYIALGPTKRQQQGHQQGNRPAQSRLALLLGGNDSEDDEDEDSVEDALAKPAPAAMPSSSSASSSPQNSILKSLAAARREREERENQKGDASNTGSSVPAGSGAPVAARLALLSPSKGNGDVCNSNSTSSDDEVGTPPLNLSSALYRGARFGMLLPNNTSEEEKKNHKNHSALPPIDEDAVRYVMYQLLGILAYLHEDCGIIHRDVKLSNLLVSKDGELKLTDFGSARFTLHETANHDDDDADDDDNDESGEKKKKKSTEGKCKTSGEDSPQPTSSSLGLDGGSEMDLGLGSGNYDEADGTRDEGLYTPGPRVTTVVYRSPECLLGSRTYTTAVDVWAAGVIFCEILLRQHLFTSTSELAIISSIMNLFGTLGDQESHDNDDDDDKQEEGDGERSPQGTFHVKFSSRICADGYDLLRKLLAVNPAKRISASAALDHCYFNPLRQRRTKNGVMEKCSTSSSEATSTLSEDVESYKVDPPEAWTALVSNALKTTLSERA